ncbi:ion transporter [Nesterenkonia muleiensis]|uniref:ion transporter n=1 Tax=Nesterenkonia muleiensis TaxID=2282648 RepID=UPI000E72E107|nr:ion transporter [Nesterenkonia muleiensis]
MSYAPETSVAPWRARLGAWMESAAIQRFVIAVILLNAAVLGMETSDALMDSVGPVLISIDTACLVIFVMEIALKLVSFGWRFFRDPWNVFDFVVVGVALVPAGAGFEVLRTLRVLRVLRLISSLPQLRKVISALLHAVPGILSTGALLALIFYVATVMATTFFRETLPEFFGSFGASLFSLFQIATLSSWETIVRPAMAEHPWAWAFFIPFIILAAFTALNLIIAVIVDAMNTLHDMPSVHAGAGKDHSDSSPKVPEEPQPDHQLLHQQIRLLRADVAELSAQLKDSAQLRGSDQFR